MRRRWPHRTFTVATERGVVDFRRDHEARNQFVSYVGSSSECAVFFVSSLNVEGCLLGNLGSKTAPYGVIAIPTTEVVVLVVIAIGLVAALTQAETVSVNFTFTRILPANSSETAS